MRAEGVLFFDVWVVCKFWAISDGVTLETEERAFPFLLYIQSFFFSS